MPREQSATLNQQSALKAKSFFQQEAHFSGQFKGRVWHTLWRAYGPFKRYLMPMLAVGFLGRAALLANIFVIGTWVDSLCVQTSCPPTPLWAQSLDSFDFLTILLILTIAGFLATAFFWGKMAHFGIRTVGKLHDETVLRMSRVPMQFFDSTPLGRIFARFSSDYSTVLRTAGGPAADLMGQSIDLLLIAGMILWVSPYYLPIIVAAIGLNYLFFSLNRAPLRFERRELAAARGPSFAHFAETVQGSATIKAYSRVDNFRRRFLLLFDQMNLHKARNSLLHNAYVFQMNVVSALLYFGTASLGLYLIAIGYSGIGAVGVTITFVTMITQTVQRFFDVVVMFEEAMTGLERFDGYLHEPLEQGALRPQQAMFGNEPKQTLYEQGHVSKTSASRFQSTSADQSRQRPLLQVHLLRQHSALSLRTKGLSLRYKKGDPWILKDLDIDIKAGEKVGIIGRTGAGKSSLIQAFFHLYPFEGQFFIGEQQVQAHPDRSAALSIHDARSLMGFIPQEPSIYNASLRANLTRLRSMKDQQLMEALYQVGLGDWIMQKTEGNNPNSVLDRRLQEGGKNLSQGQKQLLCMARCIVHKTPIILMDEATSAVDPSTETQVMQALHHAFADRTVIMIAHRLTTIERCDRIIWLDQGSIRQQGLPSEVLPVAGHSLTSKNSEQLNPEQLNPEQLKR